jgi:hypothetical protein
MGLIERWRASGRSAEEFCAEHGIREQRLRWWSAQMERRTPRKQSAHSPVGRPPAFAELRVVSASSSAGAGTVEIHSRSGLVVKVQGSVDPGLLVSVLQAVCRC